MKIYTAPMEGLTGHVFRQCFEKHFGKGNIDKYYIPFISPNKSNGYTARERADIDINNNRGMNAVPQIMANDAELFVKAADMLKKSGYDEINLNLGCPSGTVVSKYRGSGFLAKPEMLDEFLKKICAYAENEGLKISLKTRLGMENKEEFKYLLDIYNDYSLSELIIHPRVREDYYNNSPDYEMFSYAIDNSLNPLCFNGDIFRLKNYNSLVSKYPKLCSVMIGRGFVGNPFLLEQILAADKDKKEKLQAGLPCEIDSSSVEAGYNSRMKAFLADLIKGYQEYMQNEVNSIHKMKEVWIYTAKFYEGGDKALKKIKKAKYIDEYMAAVNEFFASAVYRG